MMEREQIRNNHFPSSSSLVLKTLTLKKLLKLFKKLFLLLKNSFQKFLETIQFVTLPKVIF